MIKESAAWLQTFTGRKVFPLAASPDDICIEDIAHALSMLCRFGGHSSRFYSVAEHSVLVASKTGLHGLLHDAAEAYLVDLPTPLKQLMPKYQRAEQRLLDVIYEGLHIQLPTDDFRHIVKVVDRKVLMTERAALFPVQLPWSVEETLYNDIEIHGWFPKAAGAAFLRAWRQWQWR